MRVKGASLHKLKRMSDDRGILCAAEIDAGLPFPPKRVFYVYGVPSREARGEHAHKLCHQFLICLSGSVHIILDDGTNKDELELNDPSIGLWMKPGIWGVQYNCDESAVLLVLASHLYDADDYIRDYDEFLTLKKTSQESQ